MLRKSLLAASVMMLALGVGKAASADPVFLEPYGELYSARTFNTKDARPKDAVQNQRQGEDAAATSIMIAPTFFTNSLPALGGDVDITMWGATLGYASNGGKNPWSFTATLYDFDVDVAGFDDVVGWDIAGKYTVWDGGANAPVVSLVGRYQAASSLFDRYDILLAADQKITDSIYGTVNLGYSNFNFDGAGGEFDGFKAGIGLTWLISPKLSLAGNYIFENDADSLSTTAIGGSDTWSISVAYAFTDQASLRFGGGKHSTFFGSLNWRWK